jgi:hypothetical protein
MGASQMDAIKRQADPIASTAGVSGNDKEVNNKEVNNKEVNNKEVNNMELIHMCAHSLPPARRGHVGGT